MEDRKELSMDEMENVSGGTGGSRKPLAPTAQYDVYQIKKGDTLGAIARKYGTTAEELKRINSTTIHNINDITAGYYIYVPATGIL